MARTPEIDAEIVAKFRQTRSPFKTANAVGVDISEVFEVIEDNTDALSTLPERFGGLGRPELQPFTVARRRATDLGWDNSDPAIIEARANYEAGTHIMSTGRDGAWLILYSVPRKGRPDPLPEYFLPEVA